MVPSSMWPTSEQSCIAVLVVACLQSLLFIWFKPLSHNAPPAKSFDHRVVTTSPLVSPLKLGVFRLLCFAYIVFIGVWQLSWLGAFVFKFYTVWNWWLLGVYFLMSGTMALAQAYSGPQGVKSSTTTSLLAYTATALFHINVTTVALVDLVTWLVLVPMTRADPDPARVAYMERVLFNGISYNQHGGNAALILAELALNHMPFCTYMVGYAGLWSLAFSVWAQAWHRISGRWLYPFLDTSEPWSPIAYVSLYAVHFIFFGSAYLLLAAKRRLLAAWGRPGGAQLKQPKHRE